ncbi:MAG: hypothetical protein WC119_01860 [Synergistaceae bacterium]
MRNWYKISKDLYKVAQIWAYEPDEDDIDNFDQERTFASKIKEFYELEYKLAMLRSKPFNGVPRRKENIEMQLVNSLTEVAGELREKGLATIWKWLESHAILTPHTWANKRVEEYIESNGHDARQMLNNMLWEYDRYSHDKVEYSAVRGFDYSKHLYKILSEALGGKERYPSFIDYVESAFLSDYKEDQIGYAHDDLEDFNSSNNTNFKTAEDAEEWIENNFTTDSVNVDMLFSGDIDNFAASLENWGNANDIIGEFYQNQVFPLWYSHWSEQGIDETRENVENIYNKLEAANSSDLGNLCAMVSMGLNAAHQTGDMIEYLENDLGESDLKSTMDAIEGGAFVEKANKQLAEIGVQI